MKGKVFCFFVILFQVFVGSALFSQVSKPVPKLDTIQINSIRFSVYEYWRPIISEKYRLDSTYSRSMGHDYEFERGVGKLRYAVKDRAYHHSNIKVESPIFHLNLRKKTDLEQFFKNAPKHGFNTLKYINDTVTLTIQYLRQRSADELGAKRINMEMILNDVLQEIYKSNGIDISPAANKTADAIVKNQQKIQQLYKDNYLFADSITSSDKGKYGFAGIFETSKGETSIVIYAYNTYKWGSGYVSLLSYVYLTIKREIKSTPLQRKDWFAYLFPLIRNIYNEEIALIN